MVLRHALIGWILCALASTAQPSASGTTAPPGPWYRRSRTLDITGANPRDSVVLTATGTRADRLAIVMTFYASGSAVYRQRWTSEDELYDADSIRASEPRAAAFMRARLDTVLTLVKRQRIDREQVSHMGDEAALRRIVPRPTHQVVLSFAFESSVFLAWDPKRRTMVVFMECC